jgi:regulator of replication initiation timing
MNIIERLKECTTRIGTMCGDGRPPKMSIPVREDDDDIFITGTCLKAAAAIEQLVQERDALMAENTNLRTVMMAAAVEINEHWEAHCDSEGYGPCNLVRRLENGFPEQYGYDAQTLVRMEKQCDEYQVAADKLAMENKTLRDALEQALPYMESESVINGYGYYRPGNPHNFHPDHEMCSESEIANHKAACTAYDAGNYCDDYDDGWLSPNLHVTKAPWGIGSYNEPIPELEAQCKQARAALKGANHE